MPFSKSPKPNSGSGLILKARAKINLLLRRRGRRADGYTEIATLFQTITLADTVRIEIIPSGIILETSDAGLPIGEENLAYAAAARFISETGTSFGARIGLEKTIPVAAGLGGGSSDAAAVLLGLNELHGRPLDTGGLGLLASRLGADAPFFLTGGTALGTGRGDIIEPLPPLVPAPLVIVFPGVPVRAADAYRLAESLPVAAVVPSKESIPGDIRDVPDLLVNDLEPGVAGAYPPVAAALEALRQTRPVRAMMSGSGSACFGIYAGEAEADHAAASLRRPGFRVIRAAFA